MASFDLVLRGGMLIDGTGSAARRADVAVTGDRITAVGDLSAVWDGSIAHVLDCAGRVVAPGFIDPHGHSDGSVLVDGALASHLHQGFTTQVSGNCGGSVAPVTDAGRDLIDLQLRPDGVVPRWRSFAEYLDVVDEQSLGPNVAFLVGQGTIRGSVMGASSRPADPDELALMVREVEAAMEAGAFGLSSGLIYAPGNACAGRRAGRARPRDGVARWPVRDAPAERGERPPGSPRGGDRHVRDGWPRCTSPGLAPQVRRAGRPGSRGRGRRCPGRSPGPGSRRAADQYPYTAASTTLETILPPALLALGVEECVRALGDRSVRDRTRSEMRAGNSSWENVTTDPGWEGIRISHAASHPDWAGRSFAELSEEMARDPVEVAFDALVDDRLDVAIVIDCMTEPDVETIMAVPWIAVCTDAEGRRPGHPILDAGRPHPRTYGSTARVLGPYVRGRGTLALETAVAKLTSVPAERIGPGRPRDRARGRLRRSRRVRPRHGQGRGDVQRARLLPHRDRARDRERATGHPRRHRDG